MKKVLLKLNLTVLLVGALLANAFGQVKTAGLKILMIMMITNLLSALAYSQETNSEI